MRHSVLDERLFYALLVIGCNECPERQLHKFDMSGGAIIQVPWSVQASEDIPELCYSPLFLEKLLNCFSVEKRVRQGAARSGESSESVCLFAQRVQKCGPRGVFQWNAEPSAHKSDGFTTSNQRKHRDAETPVLAKLGIR